MSGSGDVKKVFKSTGVYFVGNVMSKIIAFFMLPLYTKYIPPSDMGYYDTATAVITFFTSVLFLDIGSAILRFMLEKKTDEDKKVPICVGVAIFAMMLILYAVIAITCGFTFSFQYYAWLVVYGFIITIDGIWGYIARGKGFSSFYAAAGVISTLINIVSNVFFILVLRWDYKSLYVSQLICSGTHLIIIELKCKAFKDFRKKYFDKKLFKEMLIYALPLCVNSAAYWFLNSANKVIITSVLGTEANGYLNISYRFTQILYLVSTCFQLAWQELAYSKDNTLNKSTGGYYTKAFNLYMKILAVGLIMLIPAIKIGLKVYPTFIDPQYAEAVYLIPLAMTGAVMSICCAFLGSIFGGLKKTGVIFTSTLAGAAVNVGLIYLLLHFGVGVQSANISFLAGISVCVLIRLVILHKLIGFTFNIKLFAVLLVPLAAVIFVFNLQWYWNLVCFAAALLLAYAVLRKEINEIVASVKNKRKKPVPKEISSDKEIVESEEKVAEEDAISEKKETEKDDGEA